MCCNKATKRMIMSIVCVAVGVVFSVLSFMKLLDEFWMGLGVGFVLVGVAQLIQSIRYRTNDDYKQQVDIDTSDERNKFLSSQAWSWTGYITILCAAAAAIAYKVMSKDELSSLCCMGICLMTFIYVIAYNILKRKY